MAKDKAEYYVKSLAKAYKNEISTFVIGAGISKPLGIPDWSTLLRNIVERMHPTIEVSDALLKYNANPLILARYIREALNDKTQFNTIVHQALYVDYRDDFTNPTLRAVMKVFEKEAQRSRSPVALTYNFDCVVENWISKKGIGLSASSFDWTNRQPNTDQIEIFHCHGYLPFDVSQIEERDLVFDETEYHSIYQDHYNISNIIQVSTFIDRSCIFLGISLTDPNMRRLLDYAKDVRSTKHPHFIFRQKPKEKRLIQSELMHLFELDAKTLGVETIWVDGYDDISKIIKHSMSD